MEIRWIMTANLLRPGFVIEKKPIGYGIRGNGHESLSLASRKIAENFMTIKEKQFLNSGKDQAGACEWRSSKIPW
jgi:hypothetical protein